MSWRFEDTCCHSNFCEKPSVKTDRKNSQGGNNNTEIDNTQQICKSMLCGDRDKIVDHIIISECMKLAEKLCRTGEGKYSAENCGRN